jgi:hypothetical protein
MQKKPLDQGVPGVPQAPPPSAKSAADGVTEARARARMFLPNALDLLASVAFSPTSEAALHTRLLAAKQIVEIAGIPQPPPAAPPYGGSGDEAGNSSGAA